VRRKADEVAEGHVRGQPKKRTPQLRVPFPCILYAGGEIADIVPGLLHLPQAFVPPDRQPVVEIVAVFGLEHDRADVGVERLAGLDPDSGRIVLVGQLRKEYVGLRGRLSRGTKTIGVPKYNLVCKQSRRPSSNGTPNNIRNGGLYSHPHGRVSTPAADGGVG
jgi:hypothetical protein